MAGDEGRSADDEATSDAVLDAEVGSERRLNRSALRTDRALARKQALSRSS